MCRRVRVRKVHAVHRARHAVHERRRAATHRVAVEHAQLGLPRLRGGGRRDAAHEHTTRAVARTAAPAPNWQCSARAPPPRAPKPAPRTSTSVPPRGRGAARSPRTLCASARAYSKSAPSPVPAAHSAGELDADDTRRVRGQRCSAPPPRHARRRRHLVRLKRHARYPSTAARRAKPCPATRTSAPPSAGPLLGASARTRCARWYSKCAPPDVNSCPSAATSTKTYPGVRARGARRTRARTRRAPRRRRRVADAAPCRRRRRAEAGSTAAAAAAAKPERRDGEERAAAESAREGVHAVHRARHAVHERRRAAAHRVAVEHAQRNCRPALRGGGRRDAAHEHTTRASRAHRRTRAKLAVQRARAPPPRAPKPAPRTSTSVPPRGGPALGRTLCASTRAYSKSAPSPVLLRILRELDADDARRVRALRRASAAPRRRRRRRAPR